MAATLALDLGTRTGYALFTNGGIVSGVQNFTPSRFESSAMRFVRFRRFLAELHAADRIVHVVFEEVRRHAGVTAAHAYGGFMAHLVEWCETNGIPCEGYPVGTIKKRWTGSGNASKDAMIAAARQRGYEVSDDNEADALAMLSMALGGLE